MTNDPVRLIRNEILAQMSRREEEFIMTADLDDIAVELEHYADCPERVILLAGKLRQSLLEDSGNNAEWAGLRGVALLRLRNWGGLGKSYDAQVVVDTVRWIDSGMFDPLPPLPDHIRELEKGERHVG